MYEEYKFHFPDPDDSGPLKMGDSINHGVGEVRIFHPDANGDLVLDKTIKPKEFQPNDFNGGGKKWTGKGMFKGKSMPCEETFQCRGCLRWYNRLRGEKIRCNSCQKRAAKAKRVKAGKDAKNT